MVNESEGLLVSNDDGVFFIPNDQLAEFKLADDQADTVRTGLADDEVSGFASIPRVALATPVSFAFEGVKPIRMVARPGDEIAVVVVANFK